MKKIVDKLFFSKYKNISREKLVIFLLFSTFSLYLTIISSPFDILFYYNKFKIGHRSDKNIISTKNYYAVDKIALEKRKEKVLKDSPLVIDVDSEVIEKELERLNDAFENLKKWSNSFSYEKFVSNPERNSNGYDLFVREFSINGNSYESFVNFWSIGFSDKLKAELDALIKAILEKGYIENKLDHKRKIIKRSLPDFTESYVNEDAFINGKDDLKSFVYVWIDKKGSDLLKRNSKGVINFIINYVSPNCTVNLQETKKRENEILSKIVPTYIIIKKGEIVVNKGDIIQQSSINKLNIIIQEELKRLQPSRLFLQFLIFLFISLIFYIVSSVSVKKFVHDIKGIIFIIVVVSLTLLSSVLFYLFGVNISFDYRFYPLVMVYVFPFALSGMLLRLFLNTETAIISVFFMTLLLGVFYLNQYYLLLFVFSSAFLGLHFISYLYTRGDLLKSGIKTGFANLILMLLLTSVSMDSENAVFYDRLILSGGVFFSGFLSSTLLIIITPIFEYLFKYTTNITLFELSNLDNALLKELMLKAPGTYNHSILIGTLAETAARAIKVNPLLARVSAYYHDIGKIKKPEFFIENQMDGYNKHEELSPYMSVLVVLSHVKDGIELAKEHNLGQPIIDAIAQHHGTRLVAFFYAKALKLDPSVKEENFRYLGPKPKTREVGLIMMADAVEAACRVLEEPSPARIKNLVKKIIQDIFLDGQLDECELTLKDLNLIVESFTRTLLGIYHHRVDYPELKGGKQNVNDKKSN